MRWNHRALVQLILARARDFYRAPQSVFWVYVFPLLMTVALGIAFREPPDPQYHVDVTGEEAEVKAAIKTLEAEKTRDNLPRFKLKSWESTEAKERLRTGKTDLVVTVSSGKYEYEFVPTRPESKSARDEAFGTLEYAAERSDLKNRSKENNEHGGRYIDFLIPGLLGMGLMGGGLWGIGFVTVDMRIRKLLKRLLATPMRKSDFLASLMISRLIFMIPEVLLMLVFSWLVFDVKIAGSIWAVVFLILLGAVTFAGIGLLVACRAQTIETVSGLMNLVMLPMWVLSGVFFRSDRFPEFLHPFIRILPLTALIDALRAVMLEKDASLWSQWVQVLTLALWGVLSFALALRFFRWN
jgi:ABC transporter DrrB family efflux protein